MDDIKKMLRAIINGQSAMESELLGKIEGVHKEVQDLKNETARGFKKLTERVDKIGHQVAYLEDDAPTREEFDNLEVRVKKVEQKWI